MPTVFHKPLNNVATTVAAARSAGSPSIVVATGTGASFGSTFPLIATASRAGAVLAIFEVTGRSADTLTVSGAIEGTTDVALLVGDDLEMRPTALAISEVQAALTTLETTTVALPYATVLQVANAGRFAMWGDSVTAGAGGGGTTIPGVLSALESRVGYNGGVGGETAAQIATRFLADTARHTWPTIIEAGRNDVVAVGYSQSATLADIASMTDAMDAAGNSSYLVLTVLNAGDEPSGSATYVTITALNAAILAAYPDNSLDWRPLFVADYDPGITQDVTDHGNDVPPSSLRSDIFHPNAAGYTLLAGHLDDNRAVFSVAAMPVEPSALGSLALDDANSVHRTGAEMIAGVKTYTAGPIVEFDGAEQRWLQGDGVTGFRIFGIGDGTVYQQVTDDAFTVHGRSAVAVGAYASGSPLGLYGNVGVHVNDAGGGNLTVDGAAAADHFTTATAASSFSGYTVTRRDTGADAYVLYSGAGEFGVFDTAGGVNVLTIAATTHAATFAGSVTATSFSGGGSALTGLTSTQVSGLGTAATHPETDFLLVANNLSEVTAATARTNLGLGTAATQASTAFAAAVHVHAAADVTSGTFATARIGSGTPAAGKYVDGAAGAWTTLPAGGGANALGTYIVQTATNAPANAQILGSLATGILKVTTTTGVVSIATAGTDYLTPTGNGSGLTALNASNLGSGTAPTVRLGSGTASASTFLRGDSTWAAASGTGDMFANLVNTVVSVTTTTTLTTTAFAKLHVCTGTTADYTVTLPAVSGNTGKFIGFRMSGALTKLVTLDGNASETIDGATTRVMHGNETAILYCDGATWTKIAGKSIAMFCSLRAVDGGTPQSIATGTVTTINLNTANDPTGLMADTVNHRIKVPRTGTYMGLGVSESLGISTNPVNRWLTIISVNGSSDYASEGNAPVNGSPAPFLITEVRTFTVGDLLTLQTYQDSGVSQGVAGNATGTACYMSLMEVLQW